MRAQAFRGLNHIRPPFTSKIPPQSIQYPPIIPRSSVLKKKKEILIISSSLHLAVMDQTLASLNVGSLPESQGWTRHLSTCEEVCHGMFHRVDDKFTPFLGAGNPLNQETPFLLIWFLFWSQLMPTPDAEPKSIAAVSQCMYSLKLDFS